LLVLLMPETDSAAPTADIFRLARGPDQFHLALPYHQVDMALRAANHGLPAVRRGTVYQQLRSLLVDSVPEASSQAS
jgi:hypothetical protein